MLTIKLKEICLYVSVKKANVSFVLVSQKYVPRIIITTITTTIIITIIMGMGEVAPLYGVDSALVLTNPGVQ
jgi:predicted HAD superfamily hydrolase